MKSGIVRKTTSYIMAVPMNDLDVDSPELVYDRIKANEEFDLKEISFDDKNQCPMLTITYENTDYVVDVNIEPLNIRPDFILCYPLSEESVKRLKQAKLAITTSVTFDDPVKSYHFQIKLIHCILPDKAAVIDLNTERIFSPEWISFAANLPVSPGPAYLFSVNVVPQQNSVWIHTHGLNRCGFVELEILDVPLSKVNLCASVLSIIASKAISENNLSNEEEPFEIAKIHDGQPFQIAWKPYKKALEDYTSDIPGADATRTPEHNYMNAAVYYYNNDTSSLVKITQVEDIDLDKAFIKITDDETNRMCTLAQGTIPSLKKACALENASALVKIKLETAEDAAVNNEHIWADVDKITDDSVYCSLIQNSLYAQDISENDKIKTDLRNITDWVVKINDNRVTPDSAFLIQ
ncbi:MAG: DUF4026 domain-containing protein [Oscillospiraceae bacterium]|nr:DUF4026 domain-containing protein [Oscillospiraceae bacterium]